MQRPFLISAIAVGVFAATVALLASWQAAGLLDDSVIELSGKALMFAEGRAGMREFATAYPPLPLLFTLAFALVTPSGPLPGVLATGFVTAVLATVLLRGFLERGFSLLFAVVGTLLVIGNPVVLYALSFGPGAPLMLISAYMLGQGIFGLGTKGSVSDLMLAGIALLLLAFTHPAGMILAAASVPCLIFVAPRPYIECSPVNLLILIFFPLIFALVSFGYVRWAFGTPAFAFFDAVTTPVMGTDNAVIPWRSVMNAALTAILSAPFVAAFVFRTRGKLHRARAGVTLGCVVLAGIALQIAVAGWGDDRMIIIATAPVMAAVCAMYTFRSRLNEVLISVLLFGGIVGAGVASAVGATPFRSAAASASNTDQVDLLRLSESLRAKSGILIDTGRHPGFVAVRGTSEGLVLPGSPEFEVQLQTGKVSSSFVVVPANFGVEHSRKQTGVSRQAQDRVSITFPYLYEHGALGYGLVYDEGGWRVYARLEADRRR